MNDGRKLAGPKNFGWWPAGNRIEGMSAGWMLAGDHPGRPETGRICTGSVAHNFLLFQAFDDMILKCFCLCVVVVCVFLLLVHLTTLVQ
ncbi:MAG: hypothetical protein GY737_02215 [Desulfobacteraceae bacterium]|nr:hypothetical protein [Desulfobacteraceae bacterium]